jgi:hypothetical protein
MKPLNELIRPIGDALRVFFMAELSLRRREGQVRLVLQERKAAAGADRPPRSDRSGVQDSEALRLMQRELAELLDTHPGTREMLRHLAHFESRLARRGLIVLQRLPVPLLRQALVQLEGLVHNWSPVGLATLRSKMAVAIMERENEEQEASPGEAPAEVLEDELLLEPLEWQPPAPPEPDPAAELAAAYAAALGTTPPPAGPVELQGELGSRSAPRPKVGAAGKVDLLLPEIRG